MVGRMKVLLAVILTVLTLFTVRLMHLQVVMADEYVAKSQQNALQQRRIIPLRGRILARDGTVLADDRVLTCCTAVAHSRLGDLAALHRHRRRTARLTPVRPMRS